MLGYAPSESTFPQSVPLPQPFVSTRFGDLSYASRLREWHDFTEALCGNKSSTLIDAIARQPAGSRTVVITLGESQVGAGQLAAALILRRLCCSDEVSLPPVQIVVIPDRLPARKGYLDFHIPIAEVRRLLNAWRVRAFAKGRSPGDLTKVEHRLLRRTKRRPTVISGGVGENLHLFFPAYRLVDNETIATVASRDHLGIDEHVPTLTFVDAGAQSIASLAQFGIDPEWIITDCTLPGREFTAAEILLWHEHFPQARHVCMVPGLSHHLTDKLRGRGFRVSWLSDTADEISTDTIQRRITCTPIGMNVDVEDLRHLLSIAEDMRRDQRDADGGVERGALNTLRSAIHVITSLPVDRAYYDAAAVERFTVPTTEELLRSLREFETRLTMSRPTMAAAIDDARSILSDIANRDDSINDRKRALFRKVSEAIESSNGLFVIVRNRTTRAAVEAAIMDEFDTDLSDLNAIGIRIESRSDLHTQAIPALIPFVWASYAGFGDLDKILGMSRRPVTMLLNNLERELLGRDLRWWANRAGAAQEGSEALGVRFPGKRRFLENISGLAIQVGSARPSYATTATVKQILHLYDDMAAASTAPSSESIEGRSGVLRPAVTLTFESGAKAYFAESSMITVIRAGAEEPVELPSSELVAGDGVIFVNRTVGRTIYELMQEHLGQSPLVGAAAQMVSLWHRGIAAAQLRNSIPPLEILRKLQQAGSSITTVATVRSWLRGVVLGPQDLKDIDRLAAILGIAHREPGVLENIKLSIRSLRSVYRRFAKLVYRVILIGGTGRGLSESERALVEEHGISLADLRDAIAIETVVTIEQVPKLRPASLIGHCLNE